MLSIFALHLSEGVDLTQFLLCLLNLSLLLCSYAFDSLLFKLQLGDDITFLRHLVVYGLYQCGDYFAQP